MVIFFLDIEDSADCAYDYLKIYNGDTMELIGGPYCGTYSESLPVISTGVQHLVIEFISDESLSGYGFYMLLSSQIPEQETKSPFQSDISTITFSPEYSTTIQSESTSKDESITTPVPTANPAENPPGFAQAQPTLLTEEQHFTSTMNATCGGPIRKMDVPIFVVLLYSFYNIE